MYHVSHDLHGSPRPARPPERRGWGSPPPPPPGEQPPGEQPPGVHVPPGEQHPARSLRPGEQPPRGTTPPGGGSPRPAPRRGRGRLHPPHPGNPPGNNPRKAMCLHRPAPSAPDGLRAGGRATRAGGRIASPRPGGGGLEGHGLPVECASVLRGYDITSHVYRNLGLELESAHVHRNLGLDFEKTHVHHNLGLELILESTPVHHNLRLASGVRAPLGCPQNRHLQATVHSFTTVSGSNFFLRPQHGSGRRWHKPSAWERATVAQATWLLLHGGLTYSHLCRLLLG